MSGVIFEIQITVAAEKSLIRIPTTDQQRSRDAIAELGRDPRPPQSLKLKGRQNAWRLRVGNYRVLYEIYDRSLLVIVVDVGHRKDVYRP